MGAKGDEGVAGIVRGNDGAIGYVSYGFASKNRLRIAAVENASGHFVTASQNSISAAAEPTRTTAEISQALSKPSSPKAYPIASAIWMLVPIKADVPKKSLILLDYINLSLAQTHSKGEELGFVPLPSALETVTRRELNELAGSIMEQTSKLHDKK